MSLQANIAIKVELGILLEYMDQLDAELSDFETKWGQIRKKMEADHKSADGGWL